MNMEYQTLLIIAIFAAIVHVIEEYRFGWVEWANDFISGITVKQFMVVNTLFIVLCIIAAMSSNKFIVFSSSIFSLLLINSLAHIAPTIKQKKYSPGLVSAVLLFVPICLAGYKGLLTMNIITYQEFIISIILGIFWMSGPFIYQVIRITSEKNITKKCRQHKKPGKF
jgi:hypothetical protein